ncbi:MAG: lipoyl synthase [Candidatus Zapsychrus exili]|nr:lipoyl synthase [Candidatus Zapsychrus exili]
MSLGNLDNLVLPSWFKQRIPKKSKIDWVDDILKDLNINTVCKSASCPNSGNCWERGTATFMILGDVCSRCCRFCGVVSGEPLPIDLDEPNNVALASKRLKLSYVVVTSVTRDDLDDGGASQFKRTVLAIKSLLPEAKVEILIPDFLGNKTSLEVVSKTQADVIGHNIETVERIFSSVRSQAEYHRSLDVLRALKEASSDYSVKSSFMVGLGETQDEVFSLLKDLLGVGCDILSIGQYLAPSKTERHVRVNRFVSPEEFDLYREEGLRMGFKSVVSGPLVRSSFMAEESYLTAISNK